MNTVHRKRGTAPFSKQGPYSFFALAIAALVAGACGPRAAPPAASGSLRGTNVLLVTIDTLRADRVGAYGNRANLTPTLDRFAREGLRFDRTYAHVPLTLPSHASLLTGTYPTRHGVHDNGTFRLGDMPTLATALKTDGYRTAAFVGAFVLDARFGLNRSFDVYDDRLTGSSADLEVVQRTAEQVLAPAYDWIAARGSTLRQAQGSRQAKNDARPEPVEGRAEPWFAWVHLYDPHEPYGSRYASDPYAGEIAYTDASLGAFLDRLRTANALSNTLVVIAADHGESLGEHGERTHGLFAYDSTLRVPLVMWSAGRIAPASVDAPARLVDVAPTILDLIGAPPLPNADGRTLRPRAGGEPADDPGSYFEALNANLTRNWAPLRGIVQGNTKLIDLPIPELYDLTADQGEQQNLYASQRDRARPLEARLDAIVAAAAPAAPRPAVDADAEARLRALGYVVSSVPKPARKYTPADDPKQLAAVNAALDEAAALWARGDAANAVVVLEGVIRSRPDLTLAYDRLAFILRATGRPADAVSRLDAAAHAGHADATLLRSLGSALRDAGDLRRSAEVLEPLVRADPADLQAADALGQTYSRMGRMADAEALFTRVLDRSPNASTTWNNLGALYLLTRRTSEAIDALSRAVAINPALATAHNGLGVAYARAGQLDRAVAEWKKALELRPGYADALDNLKKAEGGSKP